MLRRSELLWFYQEGASHIFADYFKEYHDHIPVEEQHDLISAYYKRLTSSDTSIRLEAAKKWSKWEMATSKLAINHEMIQKADQDAFALAFARIECHYFINKGFFSSDEWILENLERIKHIPISITQGRYGIVLFLIYHYSFLDVVCPMKSAHDLNERLLKIGANQVELTLTLAGHSATEEATRESLIKAADSFSKL